MGRFSDLGNIRTAYAECTTAVLTGEDSGNATYTAANGTTPAGASMVVTLEQQVAGWATADPNCAGTVLGDDLAVPGGTVTVTVTDDGNAPTFS